MRFEVKMGSIRRNDPLGVCATLQYNGAKTEIFRLSALANAGLTAVERLPFSIKVLLESALRNLDGFTVTEDDIRAIANWDPKKPSDREIPFMPARVLLQDFTGVPAIVDLAAMRDAMLLL